MVLRQADAGVRPPKNGAICMARRTALKHHQMGRTSLFQCRGETLLSGFHAG